MLAGASRRSFLQMSLTAVGVALTPRWIAAQPLLADSTTKIIPGHGPLGAKSDLAAYHDMLSTVREKVAVLKKQGLSEQETAAKKPTAEFDAQWGKGFMSADVFTGIVYRTV